MDFEDFWNYAKAREKGSNEVVYHRCCDSWTSRGSKKVRDSHVEHLGWRNLIRSLGASEEDKKTLLRAKMTEEGWRIPSIINETCKIQPKLKFPHQTAFKLHDPHQLQDRPLPPHSFPRAHPTLAKEIEGSIIYCYI